MFQHLIKKKKKQTTRHKEKEENEIHKINKIIEKNPELTQILERVDKDTAFIHWFYMIWKLIRDTKDILKELKKTYRNKNYNVWDKNSLVGNNSRLELTK